MRVDRSACTTLESLAALQTLRVAQGEIALADATAARRQADDAETEATARRDSALGEYREILSCALFDAETFRLAGAVLNTLEHDAGSTRDQAATAREVEAKRELRWHRRRHQSDQIGSLHKTARRKLCRKEEDKALADAAQLLLHRRGKLQS